MDEKTPQAVQTPPPQDPPQAEAPKAESGKPQEPEYYTLLAKPPKKKAKEDVEAAKKIASRYLGIQALEKIVNNKKAKKQKREAALRFKPPETPEEFYDRGQRYVNGAECAVPFQERALYFRKAAEMYTGAGDYLDSPELAKKYGNLAQATEQEGYESAYAKALQRKKEAQSNDDWFEAARAFERITGYQDADAQAAECQRVLDRRASLKKPLLLLRVAVILGLIVGFILFSRTDRFQYHLARLAHRMGADSVAAAFLSSDNEYGDTDALLEEIYYDEGVEHMENGRYKKALNVLMKCTAPHSDLQSRLDECNYALGDEAFNEGHNKIAKDYFKACSEGYRDCTRRIEECNYNQALDSLAEENLQEALDHFISANNYADTAQLRYEPELKYLSEARDGDVVYFGSSEYLLLSREGSTLTLLAREPIPDLAYHLRRETVDWSRSTLRSTLNSQTFLDEAFSPEEQALLLEQPGSGDLVSIPSREEYLPVSSRLEETAGLWWLRDNGDQPDTAMFVSGKGEIMEAGYPVNSTEIMARPMIQINLP